MGRFTNLFPYEAARAGQSEFLEDARRCVADGFILLAQAPTGLGKTAVALSSTLEGAREQDRKVLFTTSRRSQHRMAVETIRLIRDRAPVTAVDIIAAEAMCPTHHMHEGSSRTKVRAVAKALLQRVYHVQEGIQMARRFNVCSHEAALEAAKKADALVCDYNYLFSSQWRIVLRRLNVGLDELIVVVDEAHNLPSRSREALSAHLTAEGLGLVARDLGPTKLAREVTTVARLLRSEARFIGGDSRVTKEFLDSFLSRSFRRRRTRSPSERLFTVLRRSLNRIGPSRRHLVEQALRFLSKWGEEDYLRVLSGRGGGSLSLFALDPRPATAPVFREVHAAILMSGTLHPGEMYIDVLGVPRERCLVRSYVPDFPPENRLLLVSRDLSSSYRERPESYEAYAREISRICASIPGNVAAFFTSYEMSRGVDEALRGLPLSKHILRERRGQSKAEKEDLLRVLARAQDSRGCLVMAVQGGSLSEGIDYPGKLLQGVIVAGLGLSPPKLESEALRATYSKLFGRRKGYEYAYLYPAINRMVQCAGRCIRSAEDVAAVALLDRRLLRPFYRSRFPKSFEPVPEDDIPGRVRRFFYARQHRTSSADQEGSRGRPIADRVHGQARGGEAEGHQGLPPR